MKTGIIVFGHTRPLELQSVLESLKRQNPGLDIHIWLDGHCGKAELMNSVEACVNLVKNHFPEFILSSMNGHLNYDKLIIDGLDFMSQYYERMIILEDDCFPTSSAISQFIQCLDEITDQPHIYSVYGHHFLTPAEGETITRFQGWGWATTRDKLSLVLPELKIFFLTPEKKYLQWVEEQLTDDIIRRLDVTPGRDCINVMKRFFSWDSCTCLLTAKKRLVHKKTPGRVIYNCGMGSNSTHFPFNDYFRHPPFNMITPQEVWDYF